MRTCVRAVDERKRAIAETKIAAAATELDIPVLRPIVEHGRYDLAFEIGDRILRVQCKWGGLSDDGAIIKVSLQVLPDARGICPQLLHRGRDRPRRGVLR